MFKATLPAGQPRTLRTIAQNQNSSANFDSNFGNPDTTDTRSDDVAVSALPPASMARRRLTSADKKPFGLK